MYSYDRVTARARHVDTCNACLSLLELTPAGSACTVLTEERDCTGSREHTTARDGDSTR